MPLLLYGPSGPARILEAPAYLAAPAGLRAFRVPAAISRIFVLVGPHLTAMDAVTVAVSEDAALRQALLDRERAAMTAEDRGSFLAQRYYTGSMQLRVLSGERLQSWQALYEVRDENYHQMADAMREVRAALRARDWERAAEIVAEELGSSDDSDDKMDEGSAEEVDVIPPVAALAPFSGIAYRLED